MSRSNAFLGYWKVYGGFPSLFSSAYAWLAFTITMLSKTIWQPVNGNEPSWILLSLSVAPSLMGFALSGMAIMLAFSGGVFLNAIRQGGREDSYFMKMIASFFHFGVTLTAAMIVGFVCKINWIPEPIISILSATGYFLTLYGILLVAAAATNIWHTARIYNFVSEIQPTSTTLQQGVTPPAVRSAPPTGKDR